MSVSYMVSNLALLDTKAIETPFSLLCRDRLCLQKLGLTPRTPLKVDSFPDGARK